MIYVLDASAMIAYLRNEPGSDVTEQALLDLSSQCLAHAINLCEVFYDFYRAGGEDTAIGAVSDLIAAGILERTDFDQAFWQAVGRLKARNKVSLADSCCIALTVRVGGTLLTSDHHELDPIAALGLCPISFIR